MECGPSDMINLTRILVLLRLSGVMMTGLTAVMFFGFVYACLFSKQRAPLVPALILIGIMGVIAFLSHAWVYLFVRKIFDARGTWHQHGLGGGSWLTLIAISYLSGIGAFWYSMLTM